MSFPLKTSRVSIQPLGLDDLESFVSYRQDPEVARYQSWDTDFSKDQGKELIESQAGVVFPAPGDWLQLSIRELASGKLVGDLALHAKQDEDHTFELGFTIASEHQGKGFGREAAARLLDYLFTCVGARKVVAATDRRNMPSIKLLLALGFVQLPEQTWTEEFKGEIVTVDFFELIKA
jgi:RimJ/RimL family protein N-acetyltransferase